MTTATEKKVNLKYIRNLILDNSISEKDTLLLHPDNFDDLVLEHRFIYNQGITVPFYFLRVLIMEAPQGRASLNRIRIKRDDPDRYEGDFDPAVRKNRAFEALSSKDKKIYRCHQCGNIVTANGGKVSPEARAKQIGILEMFKDRLSPIGIDICQECDDVLRKEQ